MPTDALITYEDVHPFLSAPAQADDMQDTVERFIEFASAVLSRFMQREIMQSEGTRQFRYNGSGFLDLGSSDVREVEAATLNGLDIDPDALQLAPLYRAGEGACLIHIDTNIPAGIIAITGHWGWDAVPTDLVRAIARTVSYWIDTEVMQQNDSAPDAPMPSSTLPFDVRAIAAPYRRVRVA